MLEHLPEVIIPAIVFGTPVALYWLKRHYNALEKGHLAPRGVLPASERAALLASNQELLERVQNLESIVVALDGAPKQSVLPPKASGPSR